MGEALSRLLGPGRRLLGQDTHVAQLARLLAHPDAQTVCLLAPAGLGKTAVALEAIRELQASGESALCLVLCLVLC